MDFDGQDGLILSAKKAQLLFLVEGRGTKPRIRAILDACTQTQKTKVNPYHGNIYCSIKHPLHCSANCPCG